MSLAYLLDEDISYRVAEGLRLRGVDAISIHELGLANLRIPDEDHLIYAAEQGRVLVTYNRGDFQALDGSWREQGRTHAGIVWCSEASIPRHAVGVLVRALEVMAGQYESLAGTCIHLPRAE